MDSFARAALWESGLDYLHGTGHGVGCFLNVHEGPCGISYKTFADEPLEAGMIVSDGMKGLLIKQMNVMAAIRSSLDAQTFMFIMLTDTFNYIG